jgi:catechol 2,3-dioxygenase-like lactoylglutathione lyase family enzyme
MSDVSSIDMALEVVQIPVSDIDRGKEFYVSLGWRMDVDLTPAPGVRVVQITPPHSPCSIQLGARTQAAPGSAQNTILVVRDIDAARADLAARGIDVSEVEVSSPPPGLNGPDRSYFATATFADPDGNTWLLQEVNTRLPGRAWED